MTDKPQPDKFDWATELSDAQGHVTLSTQEAKEIGARLRSMGEKLKVYEDLGGAADDMQLLRMGYAAARLEIESLRAAQPAGAQQPAIMPRGESAAAQLRAMATNYPAGHLWDKLDAKACIRGALEIEALRASRGKAPADKAITLDYKMASELLEMFGGEPGLVTLQHGSERSYSGAGLYAWYSDLPEEGARFLGAEADDEAMPPASPHPSPSPAPAQPGSGRDQ